MADEVKVGDVVTLKTGSIRMIIESIDEEGIATCLWDAWDGNGPERIDIQKETIPTCALKRISEDDPATLPVPDDDDVPF